LVEVFHTGKFSGGFGGEAWGAIADVLNDYVHGKLTAEMMLDTAFTLCHNNGPIFNKGMLYDGYTSDIYTILDVQRSGQVPQLVYSCDVIQVNTEAVQEVWKTCYGALGDKLLENTHYVDWFKVEALGALHSYTAKKKLQLENHPSKSTFIHPKAKFSVKYDIKEVGIDSMSGDAMLELYDEDDSHGAKEPPVKIEIMPKFFVELDLNGVD
jgi:hypothetical protein